MTIRLQALVLFFTASAALGQDTGAQLLKQPKPEYPDGALKGQRQGNVVFIGRIDTKGKIQDIRYGGSSLNAFIDPAAAAVRAWQFRPATRAGKPIEIAANIAVRFRVQGDKPGDIPYPILGDLSVFPADASGKKKAPEGFPVRRGADPRVRVEAVLDVPPLPKARKIAVTVQALSPKARSIVLFEDSVNVPPKATEVKIPFTATVGSDWEDGVWLVRFLADKAEAGGGQFWLAADPGRFPFVLPGKSELPPSATTKK